MIRERVQGLLQLLRGIKSTGPVTWPNMQDRRDPVTQAGESGPVTPGEEERFQENPSRFAGDPRFFGRQTGVGNFGVHRNKEEGDIE
jgi:hypothetical protein